VVEALERVRKKVTEGETAVTFTNIKEVNKLLKQDTRLALRELSASLNVTKKRDEHIMLPYFSIDNAHPNAHDTN